jgi:uracil-DNA glycosylase
MSEKVFRDIFRRAHAEHPECQRDEWLTEPCRDAHGRAVARPIVWSRRNGPWHPIEILWVGAAPGNAGGRGSGILGAHATRIPFGGDVAGANLDVLLGSIGITRNDTFITAALNQLPQSGGGEPSFMELSAPVGDFPSSLHLLRDTMLATRATLIIGLGNVGLRALIAAARLSSDGLRLPSQAKLEKVGFARGSGLEWPQAISPDNDFVRDWNADRLPYILWLTHPSAQNMSPYAGKHTLFHMRMIDTRNALRKAVRAKLGWRLPDQRQPHPKTGIYALREWRELIGPRHDQLDRLWREKDV